MTAKSSLFKRFLERNWFYFWILLQIWNKESFFLFFSFLFRIFLSTVFFFFLFLFWPASCSLQFTRISLPLVNSILAILHEKHQQMFESCEKFMLAALLSHGFMEIVLEILSQFHQRARFKKFIRCTTDSFIFSNFLQIFWKTRSQHVYRCYR